MQKELILEKLTGIASFTFVKKDGTLRTVESATSNIDLIPASDRPAGTKDQTKKKENNPDLISFYDMKVGID